MAAGSAANTIRAPGRLVLNPTVAPTDIAEYPWDGIEVGKSSGCLLRPLVEVTPIHYEALGAPGDVLEGETRYQFACFLRGWDFDAVRLLMPGLTTQGAVSGHRVWTAPGSVTPGASALPRAVRLLYVPDDHLRVPGLIAYNAVPTWESGQEMAFQRSQELGLAMVFECLRGAGGAAVQAGMLADLSI